MMYKNKPFILNLLSIACAILFLGACQQEEKKQAEEQETGPGYFSIKEFAADQFETFWGQPFTLQKIIHLNGKTDTLYKDAYNMEWGRSEEHTSELQSRENLVCRLLLEKKNN